MDGGCLVLGAVVALAGGWITWVWVSTSRKSAQDHREILARSDARRHDAAAAQKFSDTAALWIRLADAFPFLGNLEIEDETAEAAHAALVARLSAMPTLGTFGDLNLPAPLLPAVERRRHLYIVGKTGSGKSTLLEHLIARDLASGQGVGVIAPEGDFFRARLLPLVPRERYDQLVYFAPGDPSCPLAWNPLELATGDDPARAAGDLFTILRRSLSDDELGPRMQPILQNALAALVLRPGSTLWDLKRLLEDPAFRDEVAEGTEDPYVREFWLETYPRYPAGADLPLQNRLDQFLRPPIVRRVLCSPSSFSIREVLADGRLLLVDLSGLSEETRILLGALLLSKVQLELMRREVAGVSGAPFALYCDEFASFAGLSVGAWRELLSRGRKFGVALTLANQFPAQLPSALQAEIFGNVNSLVAFAVGAADANAIRRELLVRTVHNEEPSVELVEASALLDLPVGEAYAKLAGGRAVRWRIPPPLSVRWPAAGMDAIRHSWRRYAAKHPPVPAKPGPRRVREPESFLE